MPLYSLALSFQRAVCLSFFRHLIHLEPMSYCMPGAFGVGHDYTVLLLFCTEFGVSLGHLFHHLAFSLGDIYITVWHACIFLFPGLPYMDSPLQLHRMLFDLTLAVLPSSLTFSLYYSSLHLEDLCCFDLLL
ncbi:hypothetical protein BO99DRAFT_109051 [Aspergillus violaceofuscus CBS 115571]|uniref:Uncharacterized protein n=1 Tax=Aspergillus violaceofuscus (strain CBS 115571) TaxID=1450538 RepID=A0A2V5HWF0_ASPV1|nr:hypothetical protein BO99DRAFT_109051 [Aspergillus violaceofuscus CBS 115571]